MPIRRISNIGRVYPRRLTKNQRTLLEFISREEELEINDSEALRAYLGTDTREEAFEIVRERYNEDVPQERNRLVKLEDANRAINKQFIRLLETLELDEITLNMQEYREYFTLEEILNRIILAVINDKSSGYYYTLQIGNNYYTLNDNVRNRLITMVKRNLIIDEEKGSDGVLLQEVQDANEIIIKRWEKSNKYETQTGSFFKYQNITNMDFSRYGVFSDYGEWSNKIKKNGNKKWTMKSKYEDNCLIYALKQYSMKENSTLKMETIEEVKYYVKNLKVPMSVMPMIADTIKHRIRVNNVIYDTKYNVYGKEYENEISLGLIDEHYFLNDTTDFTSFAIEHYDEINHLEDYNYIYKVRNQDGKKYYKKDKDRCVNSVQAINLLIENKEKYLKKLTTLEMQLAYTQYYNNVDESFENLNYSTDNNTREIQAKNPIKKTEPSTNVFFDFETNTNEGNHKPYLVCCYFKINGKEYREKFTGYDCGKQLLDFIPDVCMLIAHNATYDYSFIVKHFDRIENEISKGTKLICCDAIYNGKKIKVKDSYSLITMKLADFNKNLKLGADMRKEVISHKLYTQENIEKRFIDIDYAIEFLKSDEDVEQFNQNLKDWKLIREDNTYDCLEYSANYCLKDCEILAKGYNVFRSMVIDSVSLNIDNILTIPSLSHEYFIKNNCYEDVYEIGGTPQRFIQKSVVGGRCMTNSNLMIVCYEILNDFDAVSLYPSAMSMMGFLKGKPRALTKHQLTYDFLKEKDGYFVEILITKIGIKRAFPLLSFVDDNGVRLWNNDMIGKKMYINKTSLEDAIEFQNIEFEILRGYYYNEGKNHCIKDVIKTLFNERKKWKLHENPVELIYKLIMNAGYGKSIMKEIETENRFFNTKESFQKYLSKNYNFINEYTEYGNGKYKVKKIKPFNQHFNLAQVGSEILSMSKRIMNRVMCLAEDIGLKIFYTDTDSIHIRDADIKSLSYAFKEKYNKTLIGKELGQFHTDFELKVDGLKCKNVVSIKSIFLGKKAYLDWLRGNNPITNELVYGFHIRMKGVCEGAVYVYANENKMKRDMWKLYKKLYNSNSINFDLMKGGMLNFKYDKNYNIITDPIFMREVKFSGEKTIITSKNIEEKLLIK